MDHNSVLTLYNASSYVYKNFSSFSKTGEIAVDKTLTNVKVSGVRSDVFACKRCFAIKDPTASNPHPVCCGYATNQCDGLYLDSFRNLFLDDSEVAGTEETPEYDEGNLVTLKFWPGFNNNLISLVVQNSEETLEGSGATGDDDLENED